MSEFVLELGAGTSVSSNAARLSLARASNKRKALKVKLRKQKERVRKLMKKVKTTEAEIYIVEQDIALYEEVTVAATDGESD